MPTFSFKGRNRQGEQITGERFAENRGALALAMKRDQILLTEVQEKKGGSWKNLDFGGNPNAKDLAVFTRQFSVMIDAGVPLVLSGLAHSYMGDHCCRRGPPCQGDLHP